MKQTISFLYTILFMISLITISCKSKKVDTTDKNKTEEKVEQVVEEEPTKPTEKLKSLLTGLHKLSPQELDGTQVLIDGRSMPIYTMSGKKLEGEELYEKLSSSEYAFDIYGNKEGTPKAVVLRKATGDETVVIEDKPPGNDPNHPVTMNTKLEYAPDFTAKDLQGNEINLSKLKGKVVVLNFWFIRCQPCVMEMPELNKLKKWYKNEKDIEFIAITHEKKEDIEKFLKKKDFDYQIIPEAMSIINDYLVMGFPTNIILDKEGNIAYQSMGYRDHIDRVLDEEIKKVLD